MSEKTKAEQQKERDLELIEKILSGKTLDENTGVLRHDGTEIIVPKDVSLNDVAQTLRRIHKEEEQMITVQQRFKAFSYDGAYALITAVRQRLGYASLQGESGPSGPNPPKSIKIEIPDGDDQYKIVEVPWGKIHLPSMGTEDQEAYLQTGYDSESFEFIVKGQLKKRFSPVFDEIMKEVKYNLKNYSIYQGQAIKVDLSFIENGGDPIHPEYMKIASSVKDDIIINEREAKLYSQVLYRITNTEDCKKRNLPIKTGVLLAGPYGTGKTMLARYTARICQENNWTFMYVSKASHFCYAYNLASLFNNTVIFIEDINRATDGERDESIDTILNVFDGVDTKNSPIISVFTSNDENDIHKGFMRAGRIDTVIPMKNIDISSAKKFIDKYCVDINGKSLLYENEDYSKAAEAFVGISPAFVKSIIDKAKIIAITNKNENEMIKPQDLIDLVIGHKEHINMTIDSKKEDGANILAGGMLQVMEGLGKYANERNSTIDLVVTKD